jgi:plastocyanin
MKKNRSLKLYGTLALALLVFFLTGCAAATGTPSGDQPGFDLPTQDLDTTPIIPQTGSNRVEVRLEEFVINMPTALTSGPTTFEVTNIGTEEHGFEIEGQGIEAGLEHHILPGESLTLDVDLSSGTYRVYCPVEDHAEEGMQLEITVSEP